MSFLRLAVQTETSGDDATPRDTDLEDLTADGLCAVIDACQRLIGLAEAELEARFPDEEEEDCDAAA